MRTRPLVATFVAVSAVSAVVACVRVPPETQVLKVKQPFPHEGRAAAYPTGMRLAAYALPYMPTVSVAVSYQAGSADDPPGKEGLAHLVEHLSYRARPAGGASLWTRLLAAGVQFDGLTQEDSTDYFATGRPDQLDELLRVEADRLRDPLAGVDDAIFARERAVVLREVAERHAGREELRALEWLRGLAVPGSPYARAPSPESVAGITLEDVRAFVRRHYTPASVILIVMGPEAATAVSARTLRAMGALADDGAPPRPPAAFRPPRPDFGAPVARDLATREADVERPLLWIAWSVPGDVDRGAPRALAAEQFVSNRLRSLHLNQMDRVWSYGTSVDRMDGVSLVIARIELRRREDARPVLEAFRLDRRWRGLLSPDDLEAKFWVRDNLLLAAQVRPEALTDAARIYRTTGEPDFVGGWQKQVAATLTGDTQEYVERYLGDARAATLLVVPGGRTAARPLPGPAHPPAGDHHGPPPDEPGAAVPPLPAVPLALPGVERRRLPNGLEVFVAPRSGFRSVHARLVFRRDPTVRFDEALQRLATFSSACGRSPYNRLRSTPDSLLAELQGPSDLLDTILEHLSCRVWRTTFDTPAFRSLRDETVQRLERSPPAEREDARAGTAILSRLLPDGPFATPAEVSRVRAYRPEDAKRFHEATFRPERAALILVGNVDPTPALWKRIEGMYGGWRGSGAPPPAGNPAVPLPARREVVIVDRPGAPDAQVTVGVRLLPRAARDEPATRVLLDVAARAAEDALRTRRALTGLVLPGLLDTVGGSAMFLGTSVAAAQAPQAAAALLDALAGGARGLDPEPLARAKLRVARDQLRQLGTSERDGARLAEAFVQGLPEDEWNTFGERLRAVTPERVQGATRALALGREVILVAGDATTIAPALRAAGLEVEVLAARPAPAAR